MFEERLDLGGEDDLLAGLREVERLDADAVADEPELAGLRVPQRKGEHAGQPADEAVEAPVRVAVHEHLGVGMVRLELIAAPNELRAQDLVVVDLTVVRDPDPAGGVAHRLGRGVGEIDDRQAPVHEADRRRRIDIDALAVRPAVREPAAHALEEGRVHGLGTAGRKTRHTTHVWGLRGPGQRQFNRDGSVMHGRKTRGVAERHDPDRAQRVIDHPRHLVVDGHQAEERRELDGPER